MKKKGERGEKGEDPSAKESVAAFHHKAVKKKRRTWRKNEREREDASAQGRGSFSS